MMLDESDLGTLFYSMPYIHLIPIIGEDKKKLKESGQLKK